jgi:hypothetical protein
MNAQFVHTREVSGHPSARTRRVLEPSDRISEVLFGLIMVLTFTGSLSIAEAGREDIRAMMIGALGSTWLGHHRQHPVPHGRLCREGPHSENAQSRARHQRCRTSASADRCPAAGRSRVSAPTGRSRICASTTARSPDATSSRSIEWSRLVGSVGHLPPGVPLDISCDSAVHRDAGCANRLRVSNAIAVGMLFITGSHTDALSASLPGWSASRWWDWGPRSSH